MDFEDHGGNESEAAEVVHTANNMESNTTELESAGRNDEELVVLDPNHPLMQRVQDALKAQLTKQNEKLEIELREKIETLKSLLLERENVGIELYGIQQQLAKQQMFVEAEQDKHTVASQIRAQKEATLNQIREFYRNLVQQLKNEREQTNQLREEVENVAARLRYITEAHQTVKDDIALTKRATEKTTTDVSKAEREKLKQDLYLEKLTSTIYKAEEQLALYGAQCDAQTQETKAIKEAVSEASLELEVVLLEKKRLIQQWNNTLIGMRRRDEAYAAMLEAASTQQQRVRSLATETDNYKRSIVKEQEKNEELTMLFNKINADISHVSKQIEISVGKKDRLKAEYMTYTRTLQETEQALAKANTDCTLKRNELHAIRTQSEREAQEKKNLEDSVMEKMMQRLTMDKASQYTQASIGNVRRKTEHLDTTVANVDNEISDVLLQISEVTSRLKRLQQSLDEQNAAMQQHNKLISRAEMEIVKNNALVERKQTQVDQLNKKIDQATSRLGGGEDLGPLELKIESMQKQIVSSMEECNQMQQFWLRQQNELVKNTKRSEEQLKAIDTLEKQLLIMNQKKARIDGQLSREQQEQDQVKHNISSLQIDVARLNTLITDKKGQQEKLEQGTILLENDFIHALKEEELQSIQLQEKEDKLREEKERILNSLVEAEHQIMLWERKIQIAREMKDVVDSDVGQTEVRAMKSEIHRMQIRHDQLMKQQEKMIQDMEKAVYRRESILLKGDAQVKAGKKEQTQGYIKKKMLDLQRQIKKTSKESTGLEEQLQDMQTSQEQISQEMETIRANCQELTAAISSIAPQIAYAEDNKKRGMSELLSSQSKVKYLTAAKEGKYKLLIKTPEAVDMERKRQISKLQSLQDITERLRQDFPACDGPLRNILLSIKSKLANCAVPQESKEVTVA